MINNRFRRTLSLARKVWPGQREDIRIKTVSVLFGWILLLSAIWCWALPAAAAPREPAIYGDLDPDFAGEVKAAGFEIGSGPLDWANLSKFNVWIIKDWNAAGYPPDLIKKFLEAGGGIYLAFFSMESAPTLFEWDPVVKPLGVVLQRAQTVDTSYHYPSPNNSTYTFALTTAVADSPVSSGVKNVWYPDHTLTRQGRLVTTLNMMLSPEWQVVVKGMPTSAAYELASDGAPDLNKPVRNEPPIFAIRQFGEGRVAIQPFPGFYSLGGGYTRLVDGIVLSRGDGKTSSDFGKLTINALKWLAEPSLKSGKLGGWSPAKPEPQKPWPGPWVTYDRWEKMRPNYADKAMQDILVKTGPSGWDVVRGTVLKASHYRGLLGVHSDLSTGRGSVADNVAAAAQAGYDFVAFAEDFAQMTPEKYDRLVAECRRLTTSKILVMPGMEVNVYRDNYPFHYLIYNFEKFPDRHYLTKDGQALNGSFDNWYFQVHASVCAIAPHQLYKLNSHPWFLRFYNGFALVTYKSGQQIDDAIEDYRYVEGNAPFLIPSVVHLTYGPEEVLAAAKVPFQMYCSTAPGGLENVPSLLNFGVGHSGGFRSPQATFVSSGPMLEQWNVVNRYVYHLGYNDRVRVNVAISSDCGLTEVNFYDGPQFYRRYLPAGRSFATSIEEYQGRYRHFMVEARDASGGRMFSSDIANMTDMAWCKTCTDQQNLIWVDGLYFKGQWALIRIPTGLPTDIRWWAGAGDNGPRDPWNPSGFSELLTKPRPDPSSLELNSHIAEFHGDLSGPHMDMVRASYLWRGAPERHDGPEDELESNLRIWTFRPLQPHSGDNNRFLKSQPHPRVSHVMMEAEQTAKKDLLPLKTDGPNLTMLAIQDYKSGNTPQSVIFTPADGGPVKRYVLPTGKAALLHLTGKLPKNGYFVFAPIERGSLAVLAPDEGLTFEFYSDAGSGPRWWLTIGRTLPTETVKAGTRFNTRCVLVKSQEGRSADEFLSDLDAWLKDAGYTGQPYYKIKAVNGRVDSTQGWLKATAENGSFIATIANTEAAHEVVPVAVSGLNDCWDAVYLNPGQKWRRHLVVEKGVGYTSLNQVGKDRMMFIGHTLVCDQPDLNLQLLASDGKWCRFQVHNSGNKPVTALVRPGPGIRDFLEIPDFKKAVEAPAGATVTVDIGSHIPEPYVKTLDCFDLQSPSGSRLVADKGAQATHVLVARPEQEKPGYLMYEAWSNDEPTGPMSATFRLKVESNKTDDLAATISVWNRTDSKVLVSRTLKASEFKAGDKYEDFTLEFNRPQFEAMDYRVQWPGKTPVTVDTIAVREQREVR